MEAIGRRAWVVAAAISAIFLIVGFLGGIALWRPEGNTGFARLEQARVLEEKEKTIQTLEKQVDQLSKELEEGSKQIAKLQASLDDTGMALQAAEQKLKSSDRTETRTPEARTSGREKPTMEPWRQPGLYETIRTTSLYEEPSVLSSKIATLPKGTRITVVGFTGDWLEIRSRRGNPPGYVHREDTIFVNSGA